jgi:hypothetical protein
VTTTLSLNDLVCSQCEEALPVDTAAIDEWRHGQLFLTGELDEDAVALLLCPECVEEEHSRAFDEGGRE